MKQLDKHISMDLFIKLIKCFPSCLVSFWGSDLEVSKRRLALLFEDRPKPYNPTMNYLFENNCSVIQSWFACEVFVFTSSHGSSSIFQELAQAQLDPSVALDRHPCQPRTDNFQSISTQSRDDKNGDARQRQMFHEGGEYFGSAQMVDDSNNKF